MRVILLLLAVGVQDPTRDDIFKKDIEEAIGLLDSTEYTKSQQAKEELVEIGRRAVPALVQALKAEGATPQKRRALCEILGFIRDNSDEAVAALTAKLQDREEFGTSISAAAAWALGRLGDDRAIQPLVDILKSREAETDKQLKYACVFALGMLRAEGAVDALLPALKDLKNTSDDEWGHNIAAAAADALGRIRAKKAVDGLAELLEKSLDQDPFSGQTVATHAARALERITGEKKGDLWGDGPTIVAAVKQWRDWHGANLTRKRIEEISAAVKKFREEQGKFPTSLVYLKAKPSDAQKWPEGGYYAGELKDGWGRDFKYQEPGTGFDFDLTSLGADGAAGGKDANEDLWNHANWQAAKTDATKTKIEQAAAALKQFQADNGRYPEQLSDLVTKPKYDVKKWPEGGYLKEYPLDGFGRRLFYRIPGTGGEPFDVISWGMDGAEGGDGINGDLWNHDKRPEKKEEKPK